MRGLSRDDAGNTVLGPWSGALAPMVRAPPCAGHCGALAWVSALGPCSTALALPVRPEAAGAADGVAFCELHLAPKQ
jgi:hypothetical protein